jgi:hypothetical protein
MTKLKANIPRRIIIISFSTISRDARVLRQIRYLSDAYEVVGVVGYNQLNCRHHDIGVPVFGIERPEGFGLERKMRTLCLLPSGRLWPEWSYESWYWKRRDHTAALSLLLNNQADVIHANDWEALPVAVRASQDTKAHVILDLHEYSPSQHENRALRRWFFIPMIDYFLRTYAPHISASITVSDAIAKRYNQEYEINPAVVMNAPERIESQSFNRTDPQDIHLVHHGIAAPDRQLELMIRAVSRTDTRYTLHFFLLGSNQRYITKLKALARELAPNRIIFHRPVAPGDVVKEISRFDIGIYLLPPVNFNQMAALPNKFFDFVAAGLAVCIGPSLEMAKLTQRFNLGLVTNSFSPFEMATALNQLTADDVDRFKLNALAAQEILDAKVELGKLVDLYADLFEEA